MKKLIFYQVEKHEIERLKFGRIREFLSTLTKDECMRVAILIDGYNDVVDELYEIKEVRKWTRELFDKFPYIIYFLEQNISETHRILMLNVSTIKASAYAGEVKKPIIEYSTEEMLKGLPRNNVFVLIDNKLLARLTKKTLEFGASIGDLDGAITAISNTVAIYDDQEK